MDQSTWSATITSKSDIDSNGSIIVTFDVLAPDGKTFPNLSVSGDPASIENNIQVKISLLQVATDSASTIQVGQVVQVGQVIQSSTSVQGVKV